MRAFHCLRLAHISPNGDMGFSYGTSSSNHSEPWVIFPSSNIQPVRHLIICHTLHVFIHQLMAFSVQWLYNIPQAARFTPAVYTKGVYLYPRDDVFSGFFNGSSAELLPNSCSFLAIKNLKICRLNAPSFLRWLGILHPLIWLWPLDSPSLMRPSVGGPQGAYGEFLERKWSSRMLLLSGDLS